VQNVVTYNVVIGVDNKDLRLKPGMTANVSVVVAQRDNVLKVPNAALRFVPPKSELASRPMDGTLAKEEAGLREVLAGGGPPVHPVWKQADSGEPAAVKVQTGISDGTYTEILSENVTVGDELIIGIEQPRGLRKTAGDLPPGFGAPGGQRRSRDRGL
jgi:HlyD family secretion protein